MVLEGARKFPSCDVLVTSQNGPGTGMVEILLNSDTVRLYAIGPRNREPYASLGACATYSPKFAIRNAARSHVSDLAGPSTNTRVSRWNLYGTWAPEEGRYPRTALV